MDSQSERKLRDLRLKLAEICLEGRLERLAALCSRLLIACTIRCKSAFTHEASRGSVTDS